MFKNNHLKKVFVEKGFDTLYKCELEYKEIKERNIMGTGLSKSKYVTFCNCPKALWLKVNKPNKEIIVP